MYFVEGGMGLCGVAVLIAFLILHDAMNEIPTCSVTVILNPKVCDI